MSTAKRPLKIFGTPISVHTRKVILGAHIKSIPHEVTPVVPVIPDSPPPNWRSLSPLGSIPAIDDNGYVLADSTAILSYLDRKIPEPALLPANAEDCGRALSLDAWAGAALFREVVQPLFFGQIVMPKIRKTPGDPVAMETALKRSAEAFTYLENLAPDAFLVGGKNSLADLAVVSNLIMFHYLGHRIEASRFPRLAAYFGRQLAAPLMIETLALEKPFVDQVGLDRTFLS